MRKTSFLLIGLMLFAGLAVLTSIPATANGDHVVYIGVVNNQNAFNVTEVTLEKNTEYTIYFVNTDPLAIHNLRIDVNDDLSESTLADSDDVLIGEANDDAAGTGASDGSAVWSEEWTTPDEDTEVAFYCGTAGHYAGGMEGVFVIGEGGASAPGFGLFAAMFAFMALAVAVPRLRRN